MNKTFEECVMDFQDAECHIDEGSVRDLYIVRYTLSILGKLESYTRRHIRLRQTSSFDVNGRFGWFGST